MSNVVEVLLKVKDDASQKIKGIKFSFLELNQALELGKKTLQAFKDAYRFAREGAELEMLRDKFDRLGEEIGVSRDVIREVADAMGGTKSQAELLASGVDLMSLGLVKSEDQFKRMMNVSGQLGMNMNQLVLTLTNMTTMRFDALGVSVDGFKEKVAELQEQGMDAQAAFTEAFLQQSEKQLLRVGSAADSAAGPFMKFEAAVKDAADSSREFLLVWDTAGSVLGGAIEQLRLYNEAAIAETLTEQYNASSKLFSATVELTSGTSLSIAEFIKWADAVEHSGRVTDTWTKKAEVAEKATVGLAVATGNLSQAQIGAQAIQSLNAALEAGALSQEEYDLQAGRIMVRMLEMHPAMVDLQFQLRDLNAAYGEGEISSEEYAVSVARIGQSSTDIQAGLEKSAELVQAFGDRTEEAARRTAEQLAAVTVGTQNLTQAQVGQEAMQNLAKALDEGTISQEEYDGAARIIMGDLLEMSGNMIDAQFRLRELSDGFDDGRSSLDDYIEALQRLGNVVDRLPENIKIEGGGEGEGLQRGGQFTVGGPGGVDQVPFGPVRLTRGETVTVTPRGAAPPGGGGGGVTVNVGTINQASDLEKVVAYIRDRTRS